MTGSKYRCLFDMFISSRIFCHHHLLVRDVQVYRTIDVTIEQDNKALRTVL